MHSLVKNTDIELREEDGDLFLAFDVRTGRALLINGTSRLIWEQVCAGRSVDAVAAQLASTYAVSDDVAVVDVVAAHVELLQKAGLLVADGEADSRVEGVQR